MALYDVFISYASEDQVIASEIVGGLKYVGFRVWYDRFVLRVGDNLLDTIEDGLGHSKFGILLISPHYISKRWTNFEMDTLIRQSIESGKKLLPIWHGVSKPDIESRHIGLAGIYALDTKVGTKVLVNKLVDVLSEGITTRGIFPSYESPAYRFIQGRGELQLGNQDGGAFNLYDAILYIPKEDYPMAIENEVFHRATLIFHAADSLVHDPARVKLLIGEEQFNRVWALCVQAGIDPAKLA